MSDLSVSTGGHRGAHVTVWNSERCKETGRAGLTGDLKIKSQADDSFRWRRGKKLIKCKI